MGAWEIAVFTITGAALGPRAWTTAEQELLAPLNRHTKMVTAASLAVVAGVAAWRADPVLASAASAIALAAAVTVAVVDVASYRIPNRIVFPALAVSAALFGVQGVIGEPRAAARALAGAGLFYAVLGAIHLAVPAAMGFGDVKLAALLGLPLGWQSWWGVLVALMAASVGGIVLHAVLVAAGRRKWRDVLPFGVYLALGATITVAIGGATLDSALA